MRKYSNKKNAQLKNYYEDRFFHSPSTPKIDPLSSSFKEDFEKFQSQIKVLTSFVELDFWVVYVDKEDNVKALELLKNLGYSIFTEASAIDYVADKKGFEVFYQLLNPQKKLRVRVKIFVGLKEKLQSIAHIFKGANWSEREIYDMFGIFIINHPNLKRILMPDDWFGHPLLKSYPLQGDEFAKWYEIDKIFGKEYREKIGPENRDPGFVDDKDTLNFSRLYHENTLGSAPRKQAFKQEYQEDQGVAFVKKVKRDQAKILDKRR